MILTFSQAMDLEAYLEYLRDLQGRSAGRDSLEYTRVIDIVQGLLDPNQAAPDSCSFLLQCYGGKAIECSFLTAYLYDEGILCDLRERFDQNKLEIMNSPYEPPHVPTQVSRRVLNSKEAAEEITRYYAPYHCLMFPITGLNSKETLKEGYFYEKWKYPRGRRRMKEDITKAFDFYYSSAIHGRNVALYCLGNFYLHGRGVTADLVQARALYELAVFRGYREGYDGLIQVFMLWPGYRQRARMLYTKALRMRMDDMDLPRRGVPMDSVTYRGLEHDLRPYAAEVSVDTVTTLRALQYHYSLDMPWRQSNLKEAARLYRQAIEEGNVSCIWDLFLCCKTQVEFGLMSPREFLDFFKELERSTALSEETRRLLREGLNWCFANLYEYGAFFGSIERNFFTICF